MSTTLGSPAIAELLSDVATLPPLANDKLRLVQTVSDQYVGMDEIVALVEPDPVLSARLLGLANSALYAIPAPVQTVKDAIVRVLGLDLTRGVVLGMAVASTLDIGACAAFKPSDYWSDSLTLAELGQEFSNLGCAGDDHEVNVYVLGLLNRVGLFALAAVQPAPLSKLLQSADPAPLAERLRKEFGFDHRDAGYALLRQWSVPGPIIEAMNPGTNAPVGSSLHVALAKRCMDVCHDDSATIQEFSGQLEQHGIALSASELMSRHQKAHDKARQICSSVM